jgi:Uma2 family endonuclease
MNAVSSTKLISVADYLAGERDSQARHEYLGGIVYAMAGGTNLHNLLAGNLFAANALRGQPCKPYNSETKVRIQSSTQVRFYYPDAMVVCQKNAPDEVFQDQPVVLAEVLSSSTRRVDEGEKKDAYLTIPSLSVYLLVEQQAMVITAFRRTEQGFVREVYEGPDAVIPLEAIGCELALADIYLDATLGPEPALDS